MIQRGELWWADLGEPRGSEPALRRPVLIIQADSFNRSKIQTVVLVSLTTNLKLSSAPGNVLIRSRRGGLAKASVVNVSQVSTLDRRFLIQRIGTLPQDLMDEVEEGIKLALAL